MPTSLIAVFAEGFVSGGLMSTIASFAINMIASSILSKGSSPDAMQNNTMGDQKNAGNPVQVPPRGDNKLPVIYGSSYVGGIVTDLSITSDNQVLYYCLALSEVTNSEGYIVGGADVITFGNVYWGGKKVIFNSTDLYKVDSLLDESSGLYDTAVAGYLEMYFYNNGSTSPTNSAYSAYSTQVMGNTNLIYQWTSAKAMSNCAFVVIKITYNQDANLTGLQQTKFQVTNARTSVGDCFLDYMTSERYGAALATSNIDTTSLTALTTYSNVAVSYINYSGGTSTQSRVKFNGQIDPTQNIMTNLQYMATCCDCLLRYNEITGKWGVIVQSTAYTIAMALTDSNIIGPIQVTPLDIASSFNIAEVKFADYTTQDGFNSATYDLAVLNPSLLYPNEPINKQNISLPLINNSITAQQLAYRYLKANREDLQVQCVIDYSGLQLEAGDIVSLTNANYGWSAKLFRISKVVENFGDDGSITASLTLMEFNPAVYNDETVTQFTPSPNTGFASPLAFGSIPTPTISTSYPNAATPSFIVNATTSAGGIVQYVEIWYSAYSNPTTAQRIFAGTSAVQSSGTPYTPSTALQISLTNIASGDWYFFARMVNSLGSSSFSNASSIFRWRPTTFSYVNQYLIVAYGDDLSGTNITSSPIGKSYYGLYNSTTSSYSTTASDYTWYLAQPTFGSVNKLCFINRTSRRFSFGTAPAGYASSTGSYVPASTFDNSLWSALPDGTNYIDLDIRTGQLTRTGTTTVGGGQIAITNNPDGTMIGSLAQFLDFGGSTTYTSSVATLTVDIYGRVVGITPPDSFYYTRDQFTATASQTVFTPTARQAGYITGQDLVFKNGVLLDTTEYSETSTTVTLGTACAVNDRVAIISFRSVSASVYYEDLGIVYSSGTGTATLTYTNQVHQLLSVGDQLTFSNSGTPTQYTISTINYTTKQIVFTGNFTATASAVVYRYRASGSTYPSFSRWTATLTAATSYTPTVFEFVSGSEMLYLNGTIVNDQDYDLVGNTVTNLPSTATGNFTILQFAPNNQGVPNGYPAAVTTFTTNGVAVYSFSYNSLAFELFANGSLLFNGTDYTTSTGSYTIIPTPNNNTTILVQQTFNRTGAA